MRPYKEEEEEEEEEVSFIPGKCVITTEKQRNANEANNRL